VKISKETKVGVLAIFSIGLLYYGFNYLKGRDLFNPTQSYHVIYSNVAGLGVSNPVTVSGFKVGQVGAVSIDQENSRVIVRLDIDKNIVVGDSAYATLTSDLLGSKEIRLNVGIISRPLEVGDTITGVFDKGIEALIEGGENIAVSLEETIGKVNSILDSLEGGSDDIKETLDNINAITRELRRIRFKAAIDQLQGKLNQTIESVDSLINYDIREGIQRYTALADSIDQIQINETLANADEVLINLNSILTKIDAGEGDLGKLVNEDSLYSALNKTILDLDKLLIHLDENPRHFFSPFGKKKKKKKDR
jgi:phospholipid/cholesterol/gamma-HCH transport system substrate-binding protein